MIAVSKMYKQNLKQTWFQKRFPEIFFAFCKVKYAAAEGNSNHSPLVKYALQMTSHCQAIYSDWKKVLNLHFKIDPLSNYLILKIFFSDTPIQFAELPPKFAISLLQIFFQN